MRDVLRDALTWILVVAAVIAFAAAFTVREPARAQTPQAFTVALTAEQAEALQEIADKRNAEGSPLQSATPGGENVKVVWTAELVLQRHVAALIGMLVEDARNQRRATLEEAWRKATPAQRAQAAKILGVK